MNCSVEVEDANCDRVLTVLGNILREHDGRFCSCQGCVNAVVAAALNCLIPHYYVDAKCKDHVGAPWVVVEAAVREAIEEVTDHSGKCRCVQRDETD